MQADLPVERDIDAPIGRDEPHFGKPGRLKSAKSVEDVESDVLNARGGGSEILGGFTVGSASPGWGKRVQRSKVCVIKRNGYGNVLCPVDREVIGRLVILPDACGLQVVNAAKIERDDGARIGWGDVWIRIPHRSLSIRAVGGIGRPDNSR